MSPAHCPMTSASPSSLSCILDAHACLLHSGSYLMDTNIATKSEWVSDGHGHILVCVLEMLSEVPSAPGADVPNSCNDVQGVLTPTPPLTSIAECAILSAIVCIDQDDFWLTADGGCQGLSSVWKDLLDVKPLCSLSNLGIEPVCSDFPTVLQMLQGFTEHCLHHKLFKNTLNDLDSDVPSDTAPSSTTLDAFSFKLFPLTKETNHTELLALKPTHQILPLPAYDFAGDLICPAAYCHSLQGCTTEMHFTLSHWGIAGAKCDVYGGSIHLLFMFVPPMPSASASWKRKFPLHLDDNNAPMAKMMRV
ncbi:hypothetical protein EDD16DRAFT_1703114 [Pisolithus croceorrhizus]|nr:hypothetical protein EV401DRAFT_2073396 [Pisolithus croceorrhizus]KAI6125624.1 hypothetical protein EDD16DRAFT_1703114 [Pisolithus croceorrhizus]KAI6169242.1 hypothetical protein EDD17DRAFT_1749758 [Pisolithus thermaeus]